VEGSKVLEGARCEGEVQEIATEMRILALWSRDTHILLIARTIVFRVLRCIEKVTSALAKLITGSSCKTD